MCFDGKVSGVCFDGGWEGVFAMGVQVHGCVFAIGICRVYVQVHVMGM